MDKMRVFELSPANGRKSFYGKAKVIETCRCIFLKSYDTIVAYKDSDGSLHRTWDGWSKTTGNHLYAFAGIRKEDWDKMPVEDCPDVVG
jgi:hypothetical protein